MVETDIKHQCFYVEEELLSMPSYPKERQRAKLKRKKSGSADGTSSKKLDSRIDKVATLIMPESLVAMTFCQVVTIDMENLTKILEKTTKEEGLPADEDSLCILMSLIWLSNVDGARTSSKAVTNSNT